MSARRTRTVVLLACVVALAAAAWFAVTAGDAARPGHPSPDKTWIRFVDEDGAPVARVEYAWTGGWPATVAATDDDVLEVLRGGYCEVDVHGVRSLLHRWLGGVRPVGHERVVIPGSRPVAEMVVVLGPPRVLAGRVVDPGGAGVPGLPVSVGLPAREGRSVMPPSAAASWKTSTDRDGGFRIDGFGSGDYEVSIRVGREWVAPRPVVVRGGDEGLRVALVAAKEIRVTVLDLDGRPVPGAQVTAGLARPTPPAGPDGTHRLRREMVSGPSGRLVPSPSISSRDRFDVAKTDDDGRVALGGVPPEGPVALVVDPPSDRADLCATDSFLDGPHDAEVRFAPAAEVSGVLRTPDGAPVPGAWISTQPAPDLGMVSRVPFLRTDASGRFREGSFHSGARVFVVGALGGAGEICAAEVVAPAEDVRFSCDVGAYVVVTCADAPPSGIVLHVVSATGAAKLRVDPALPTFVPRLDPAATYTLLAGPTQDGAWGVARDVRADGRTVALSLAPGLPVAGRVVPARSCTVEASKDGVVLDSLRSDADGRFRFAGLPAGGVHLEAIRDGGQPRLAASADVEAGAGDVRLGDGPE